MLLRPVGAIAECDSVGQCRAGKDGDGGVGRGVAAGETDEDDCEGLGAAAGVGKTVMAALVVALW